MNSSVTEFILFGLTQDAGKQKALFGVFFMLYLATLLGNFPTVVTIKTSRTLGSPMYFFLLYLSFADACFSTTTAPRLIVDALSQKKSISYNECMTQVFAAHFFGCMEIFVLILMALDHCVATFKSFGIHGHHELQCLQCAGDSELGGILYPLFSTSFSGFGIAFLWPQCD